MERALHESAVRARRGRRRRTFPPALLQLCRRLRFRLHRARVRPIRYLHLAGSVRQSLFAMVPAATNAAARHARTGRAIEHARPALWASERRRQDARLLPLARCEPQLSRRYGHRFWRALLSPSEFAVE